MLLLDIDHHELADLAQRAGATEAMARASAWRAMRRTIRHVASRVVRDVARATGLPNKVVRERMRIRMPRRGGSSSALWLGLDPLNPVRVGARQTRRGVRARRHQFDHAFIARGKGGSRLVFRREGKARTPLEVVRIHVHQDALRVLRARTFGEASDFFMRQFEQDLRWRLEHAR